MAGDTDADMKSVSSGAINIDFYRKLVQNYINLVSLKWKLGYVDLLIFENYFLARLRFRAILGR